MKVNEISTNYFLPVNVKAYKNNQPSFCANLNVASDIARAYHNMGGDISGFSMKIRQAARYIENLPDKTIFVELSESASNAVKKNQIPKDPAIEVFVGKRTSKWKHTVESEKIAANLISRNFEDEVYNATKTLLG